MSHDDVHGVETGVSTCPCSLKYIEVHLPCWVLVLDAVRFVLGVRLDLHQVHQACVGLSHLKL